MTMDELLQPIISALRQSSLPLPDPYSATTTLSTLKVPMEMRTMVSAWSKRKARVHIYHLCILNTFDEVGTFTLKDFPRGA